MPTNRIIAHTPFEFQMEYGTNVDCHYGGQPFRSGNVGVLMEGGRPGRRKIMQKRRFFKQAPIAFTAVQNRESS